MKTIQFNDLTTLSSIAKNFGIQIQYLENLVHTANNSNSYTQMKIPKVSNPHFYRTVYQPKCFIDGLHKDILTEIKTHWKKLTPPNYLGDYSLEPSKEIVENSVDGNHGAFVKAQYSQSKKLAMV